MFLHLGGGLCPVVVSVRGGRSLCQEDLPYGKERAVRILLECILVTNNCSLF